MSPEVPSGGIKTKSALKLVPIIYPGKYGGIPSTGSRDILGWSGGAMVLGKLPVPGRPTIWITVGQGPSALAVGAGGGLFGHFYSHLSLLFSFSLSLGDGPI